MERFLREIRLMASLEKMGELGSARLGWESHPGRVWLPSSPHTAPAWELPESQRHPV